jgi:hypothetical protein
VLRPAGGHATSSVRKAPEVRTGRPDLPARLALIGPTMRAGCRLHVKRSFSRSEALLRHGRANGRAALVDVSRRQRSTRLCDLLARNRARAELLPEGCEDSGGDQDRTRLKTRRGTYGCLYKYGRRGDSIRLRPARTHERSSSSRSGSQVQTSRIHARSPKAAAWTHAFGPKSSSRT